MSLENTLLRSLSVWSTDNRKRIGAFRIKTNKKRVFFPEMRRSLGEEIEMEVGSGILMGAFGTKVDTLISLGFLILRKITAAKLINVEYEDRENHLLSPRDKRAYEVTLKNTTSSPVNKGYGTASHQRVDSGSWVITAGLTLGHSFKVEAVIPAIQGKCLEFTEKTETCERDWSDSTRSKHRVPLVVSPLKKTLVTVDYTEHIIRDLPFVDANMEFTLGNDSKFYTNVSGTYNSVRNSGFRTSYEASAVWNEMVEAWEYI